MNAKHPFVLKLSIAQKLLLTASVNIVFMLVIGFYDKRLTNLLRLNSLLRLTLLLLLNRPRRSSLLRCITLHLLMMTAI
jgi:hypothetical protein